MGIARGAGPRVADRLGRAVVVAHVDVHDRRARPGRLDSGVDRKEVRLIGHLGDCLDDRVDRARFLAALESADFTRISEIESALMRNPYTIHQAFSFMEAAPLLKIYSLVDGKVVIDEEVARQFSERERLYPTLFDMDNLAIWDRVLTSEEIRSSYSEFNKPVVVELEDNLKSLTAGAWNIWHGGKHFTVDEHTIFAIGLVHRIETGALKADHPLSTAILPKIQSRRALYVAVLLHDIAKGRGGKKPSGKAGGRSRGAKAAAPARELSPESRERVLEIGSTALSRAPDSVETYEYVLRAAAELDRLDAYRSILEAVAATSSDVSVPQVESFKLSLEDARRSRNAVSGSPEYAESSELVESLESELGAELAAIGERRFGRCERRQSFVEVAARHAHGCALGSELLQGC